jgi:hypothetical protein
MSKFAAIEAGTKPIGSLTTYLRKLQRMRRTGRTDVPCGTCNACCRSPKLHVDLRPEERADWPDAVPLDDGWALPKKPDGSCAKLIDGKCSVYARRPISCRAYDCRLALLSGMIPGDDPIMRKAITQWEGFAIKTAEDHIYHLAARLAVMDGGVPENCDHAIRKVMRLDKYLSRAKELDARLTAMYMRLTPEQKEQVAAETQQRLENMPRISNED